MILEIVIYIVVVLVSALAISLFAESLTNLVKGFGSKGKRDLIVSIAAIGFSYYFFRECIGYFENGGNFKFKYQYLLLAGLLSLGIVTVVRESVKAYSNKKDLKEPTGDQIQVIGDDT